MVHLNSILHPTIASSDLIFSKTTSTPSTASSTTAAASSTNSFGAQLAAAIEGYLAQSGNGSQFEINVQEGQGQTAGGASQFTVTVTNLSDTSGTTTGTAATNTVSTPTTAASTATTTAAPTTATASAAAAAVSVSSTPAAVVPAASPFGGAMPSAAELANMTPDEAYWAEQPAAVQALQNMPADQVGPAAMALAQQGYTIDVPIMVWGWDPLTTMVERQNYGYTWVPSGLQSPVDVPPGLSFPGLASYDPNNPPPGSIPVTTAFAAGTNMQDVFIDPAQITASMTLSASS